MKDLCPNSSDLSLSPIVFPQSDVLIGLSCPWWQNGWQQAQTEEERKDVKEGEKGKKKGFKGEKASALLGLG